MSITGGAVLEYSALFDTVHSLLDRAKNNYITAGKRKPFLSFCIILVAVLGFFSIQMCFFFL